MFSSTVIQRLSAPPRLSKLHVTRGPSLAYAVTVLTCVVLFSHFVLFMRRLDTIMESKGKCTSDNAAKRSCKVLALRDKIQFVSKLSGAMRAAAAAGLILR
jgi:hypothetical protein